MLKKLFCLVLALAICAAGMMPLTAEELSFSQDSGAPAPRGEAPSLDLGLSEISLSDIGLTDPGDTAQANDAFDLQLEPQLQDDMLPIDDSEAVVPAYCRVIADPASLYANEQDVEPFATIASGSVVLALETVEARRRVAFNTFDGIVTEFAEADALEALDDEQVAALMESLAASGVDALYQDDPNLPLATVECTFTEAPRQSDASSETSILPEQKAEGELALEEADTVSDASATARYDDNAASEPARIELSATKVTLGIKQVFQLNPVIYDSKGNVLEGASFTVTSSKPKYVKAYAGGKLQALKKGSCTVTVKTSNDISATCSVEVVKPPSKVTLSPQTLTIGAGESQKLKATFTKGTMASCTFSSNNESIASVDKNGVVTGIQPGTAVITVKTHNSKKATATVNVVKGPDFLTLNADYELVYNEVTCNYDVLYTKTLSIGSKFQITYENEYQTAGSIAAYESQNTRVASVSKKGVVKALSAGVAIIIVRSTSGAEAKLQVTVPGTPLPSIAFAPDSVTVIQKQSTPAPALTGSDITADELAKAKLTSSNKKVFTVKWSEADNQWVIKGVKAGTAVLTAKVKGVKATASVTVVKSGKATSIAFDRERVYMDVGDTYAPVVRNNYGVVVKPTISSADASIVSVDSEGKLKAVAEGSTTITAVSGSLKATMTACVQTGGALLSLDVDSLRLGVGQRHALKATVNGDGASSNLSFSSSMPNVATVSDAGVVIARAVGSTVITVKACGGSQAQCSVSVCPAPTAIAIEPASVSARLGEPGQQLKWIFGSSDEIGEVSFSSADPAVADVSAGGFVSFVSVGETTVSATTDNGLTASIPVKVLPTQPVSDTTSYRLFAAYSYCDSSYDGYLPFPRNNATSMSSVFKESSVSGQIYSTKVMGNPGKTSLLSGISRFFSETTDNDVSIVYLCSHGHMTASCYGYRMSLPGYDSNKSNANYYLTSKEIFDCVRRIRGKVVLIVDSCYSGAFIQDMSEKLAAQNGRIAVLTAAYDTRATYYNVNSENKSVDFFTFFLLQGLGFNEREGWWNLDSSGNKGSYPGYLAADAAGNGDGAVTLGELFNYAYNCIRVNIPNYMKKSWYWGDKTKVQDPQYYSGALNSLVVYQPAA